MSDASISQDEIDALLAGVDTGSAGDSSASSATAFTDSQRAALNAFFSNVRPSIKSSYDSMTAMDIPVEGPDVSIMSRDALLRVLPEMVVATAVNFSGGLSGDHMFILSADLAKQIVSLVNNESDVDLDDMALSVISEAISQHVGVELTEMERGGIHGAANNPAETVYADKATVRLPQEDFAVFQYMFTIDHSGYPMWEIMQYQAATDLAKTYSAAPIAMQAAPAQPVSAAAGFQNAGVGMNMSSGMQGMPPNVQPVQFPNLQNMVAPQGQSNISLLMDVYMEMTVELGRTKKVIKDILGMGEGTIIELDKLAGEPVDILVNHKPIAKGEVVVIDENFGVRVTEILSPSERISDI